MPTTQQPVTIRSTTNVAEFLGHIETLISADPVGHSVIATNAGRRAVNPDPAEDNLWLWADRDGTAVGAAMHTPPRPPHMATDDALIATVVAEFLVGTGRLVTGIDGCRAGANAFARRWVELRPCAVSTVMDQGIYVLDELVPPQGVSGLLRPATTGDATVVCRWTQAFITEADAAAQSPPATEDDPDGPRTAADAALADAAGRIATGCLWLWEDGGEPVSMVYASPAYGGVSRISLVYTPSRLRRRGYASACVAAASAIQTALGHRCMLFTDLANPTSNDIYHAVGYRRCGDAVQLRFG